MCDAQGLESDAGPCPLTFLKEPFAMKQRRQSLARAKMRTTLRQIARRHLFELQLPLAAGFRCFGLRRKVTNPLFSESLIRGSGTLGTLAAWISEQKSALYSK